MEKKNRLLKQSRKRRGVLSFDFALKKCAQVSGRDVNGKGKGTVQSHRLMASLLMETFWKMGKTLTDSP
jgi:hypothetical protein